jgi:hypothetical protein
MSTAAFIATGWTHVPAALAPAERWQAVRDLHDRNPLLDRAFIIAGLIAISVLVALLIAVHYGERFHAYRKRQKQFKTYGRQNGLSGRELKVLNVIAAKAGIESVEAIFTTPSAFDKGVNSILLETKAIDRHHGQKRFESELSVLRAKLGFDSQAAATNSARRNTTSSRQLPVGKPIQLTRRRSRSERIEAEVIGNGELELTIKMPMELEAARGEVWNLQYNLGPSVWEFETPLLKTEGMVWTFGHSNEARFISRRRFIRVEWTARAFISKFPFINAENADFPEFVEGNVKEIAGPGFLVQAPIHVSVGERLLARIELPEGRLVQDIAVVRHVRSLNTGFSIALEFRALGESEIDELIRATNAAQILKRRQQESLEIVHS